MAAAEIVFEIPARHERRRLSGGHLTAKNVLCPRNNAQHLLGFML
ncbi:hypothetical protein HMPREF0591_1443 [Mycobacterium parascrofulaceum ATCC BAA-614]|uniref:Uncharacterized protein n=1 Tax=Mycobacterium parascrofulaceum ATCC BAA-614 TaxID=525368 RepID=D5P5J9_9MYCO|nr:hypothetical protein [Mycobacterium parascrofulaceum]EFG78653.1 hypothetical protein HMPREF0591_1443 [Mycobacterium parascrofulaceum ATCC BAA-614]